MYDKSVLVPLVCYFVRICDDVIVYDCCQSQNVTFRLQLPWTEVVLFAAGKNSGHKGSNQNETRKPFALRVHRGRFDVSRRRRLRHAVNAKSGAFSDSRDSRADVIADT